MSRFKLNISLVKLRETWNWPICYQKNSNEQKKLHCKGSSYTGHIRNSNSLQYSKLSVKYCWQRGNKPVIAGLPVFSSTKGRGSHDIPSTSCSNETRRCTRWMFAEWTIKLRILHIKTSGVWPNQVHRFNRKYYSERRKTKHSVQD